ncbi:hypothetical protein WA026_015286 [Henosepilachna vigintioctopunctata]|uniref:Uncharacterized protein n=1 Tax=Henosepilachna vigintioctopunctata TaxID=420089 RepID=A0AAW1TL42_9CUCU
MSHNDGDDPNCTCKCIFIGLKCISDLRLEQYEYLKMRENDSIGKWTCDIRFIIRSTVEDNPSLPATQQKYCVSDDPDLSGSKGELKNHLYVLKNEIVSKMCDVIYR